MEKIIFEFKRWLVTVRKTESSCNGNGLRRWTITITKVLGTGDDGVRGDVSANTGSQLKGLASLIQK